MVKNLLVFVPTLTTAVFSMSFLAAPKHKKARHHGRSIALDGSQGDEQHQHHHKNKRHAAHATSKDEKKHKHNEHPQLLAHVSPRGAVMSRNDDIEKKSSLELGGDATDVPKLASSGGSPAAVTSAQIKSGWTSTSKDNDNEGSNPMSILHLGHEHDRRSSVHNQAPRMIWKALVFEGTTMSLKQESSLLAVEESKKHQQQQQARAPAGKDTSRRWWWNRSDQRTDCTLVHEEADCENLSHCQWDESLMDADPSNPTGCATVEESVMGNIMGPTLVTPEGSQLVGAPVDKNFFAKGDFIATEPVKNNNECAQKCIENQRCTFFKYLTLGKQKKKLTSDGGIQYCWIYVGNACAAVNSFQAYHATQGKRFDYYINIAKHQANCNAAAPAQKVRMVKGSAAHNILFHPLFALFLTAMQL